MKHLLLTTIAAVLVVGCGASEAERAMIRAAWKGDIEAIKQHLAAGADVNASGFCWEHCFVKSRFERKC